MRKKSKWCRVTPFKLQNHQVIAFTDSDLLILLLTFLALLKICNHDFNDQVVIQTIVIKSNLIENCWIIHIIEVRKTTQRIF